MKDLVPLFYPVLGHPTTPRERSSYPTTSCLGSLMAVCIPPLSADMSATCPVFTVVCADPFVPAEGGRALFLTHEWKTLVGWKNADNGEVVRRRVWGIVGPILQAVVLSRLLVHFLCLSLIHPILDPYCGRNLLTMLLVSISIEITARPRQR